MSHAKFACLPFHLDRSSLELSLQASGPAQASGSVTRANIPYGVGTTLMPLFHHPSAFLEVCT